VLTAACGGIPAPQVQAPKGRQFIPMVPDSIDDVGLAPSVVVDGEGLPNISYFGFTAELVEGEIPVARPVGSPFLQTEEGDDAGAVLLADLTPEQIWTRGAIAQPRESPSGVPVPFEPAAEPSLATLTPTTAKGTDIAITGADVHAAWTADTGVWYGVGPSFEIAAVEETSDAGAPSIAVDGSGVPIVAYAVAGDQPEVRVAERSGERWQVTSVATLSACDRGCPPATHVALLGDEPLVVVADPASGEVIAAVRQGDAWTTEVVATGATGGASLAISGDSAAIAFYTPAGVALATGRFGSWSVEEVAPFAEAAGEQTVTPTVPTLPGTGVAIDDQGTTWVAWQDGVGVHLASRTEGRFEEVGLLAAQGGVNPSLAVTGDGASVYLAWYDPKEGDLRLGTYAEIAELKIGVPSPAPSVVVAPGPADCGVDGEPILEIVALGTQFDPRCLVALAGEPVTITFDNQDPAPTQHNFEVLTEQGGDVIAGTDVAAGPVTQELPLDPLDAGNYYFQCLVHPDVMTGTLAVVEGAGGGGGGG
jgi:plastocyanin